MIMVIHNFREIIAWQKAMDLAGDIYSLTKTFPAEERFALTSQIQRAVTSIPSNIAEGAGRATPKELVHFLAFALGSAYELETEITLSHHFGYLSDKQYDELLYKLVEVQKLVFSLMKKYSE